MEYRLDSLEAMYSTSSGLIPATPGFEVKSIPRFFGFVAFFVRKPDTSALNTVLRSSISPVRGFIAELREAARGVRTVLRLVVLLSLARSIAKLLLSLFLESCCGVDCGEAF